MQNEWVWDSNLITPSPVEIQCNGQHNRQIPRFVPWIIKMIISQIFTHTTLQESWSLVHCIIAICARDRILLQSGRQASSTGIFYNCCVLQKLSRVSPHSWTRCILTQIAKKCMHAGSSIITTHSQSKAPPIIRYYEWRTSLRMARGQVSLCTSSLLPCQSIERLGINNKTILFYRGNDYCLSISPVASQQCKTCPNDIICWTLHGSNWLVCGN